MMKRMHPIIPSVAWLCFVSNMGCSSSSTRSNGTDGGGGESGAGTDGGGSMDSGGMGSCARGTGLATGTSTWTGTIPDPTSGVAAPFSAVGAVANTSDLIRVLTVVLTDFADACGYAGAFVTTAAPLHKANAKTFYLAIAPMGQPVWPIPAGTYQGTSGPFDGPGGTYEALGFTDWTDAQCGRQAAEVGMQGTLIISASDMSHVAGSFDGQLGYIDPVNGPMTAPAKFTFNAPYCSYTLADTCCVP